MLCLHTRPARNEPVFRRAVSTEVLPAERQSFLQGELDEVLQDVAFVLAELPDQHQILWRGRESPAQLRRARCHGAADGVLDRLEVRAIVGEIPVLRKVCWPTIHV